MPLSHYARRAVIISLEHAANTDGEILAAPILRGVVPVIPTFSAEVMPVLSKIGFKLLASLENSPKGCRNPPFAAGAESRRLGHVPLHLVVVALQYVFEVISLLFFPFFLVLLPR